MKKLWVLAEYSVIDYYDEDKGSQKLLSNFSILYSKVEEKFMGEFNSIDEMPFFKEFIKNNFYYGSIFVDKRKDEHTYFCENQNIKEKNLDLFCFEIFDDIKKENIFNFLKEEIIQKSKKEIVQIQKKIEEKKIKQEKKKNKVSIKNLKKDEVALNKRNEIKKEAVKVIDFLNSKNF